MVKIIFIINYGSIFGKMATLKSHCKTVILIEAPIVDTTIAFSTPSVCGFPTVGASFCGWAGFRKMTNFIIPNICKNGSTSCLGVVNHARLRTRTCLRRSSVLCKVNFNNFSSEIQQVKTGFIVGFEGLIKDPRVLQCNIKHPREQRPPPLLTPD